MNVTYSEQHAATSEPATNSEGVTQRELDNAKQMLSIAEKAIVQMSKDLEANLKLRIELNAKLNETLARNGMLSQQIVQMRDEHSSIITYAHHALMQAKRDRKALRLAQHALWFPLSFIYHVTLKRALPLAGDVYAEENAQVA